MQVVIDIQVTIAYIVNLAASLQRRALKRPIHSVIYVDWFEFNHTDNVSLDRNLNQSTPLNSQSTSFVLRLKGLSFN